MPGVGVRTAARILLEVGDASNFVSSAHLAAYAGIAPSPAAPAPASRASTPPAPATVNSNARSSSPRSLPCTTRPAGPTRPEES
jgi:transposase IS116/IS110/IS902 family protein